MRVRTNRERTLKACSEKGGRDRTAAAILPVIITGAAPGGGEHLAGGRWGWHICARREAPDLGAHWYTTIVVEPDPTIAYQSCESVESAGTVSLKDWPLAICRPFDAFRFDVPPDGHGPMIAVVEPVVWIRIDPPGRIDPTFCGVPDSVYGTASAIRSAPSTDSPDDS